MTLSLQRQDRFRGALLGLAVGDAIGTTVEFQPKGSFAPITDMIGGGPFRLKAGQWTDDTSMALCLGQSLLDRQGFDAVDQLSKYVHWWHHGYMSSTGRCFDIGTTVRAALRRFEQTGEPYCGSTDPQQAGNGSIMRLAPAAMYYFADPVEAVTKCGESSRTTHAAVTAVDGCRYLGALIIGALAGEPKAHLLSCCYLSSSRVWTANPLCPEIADIADGSFLRKSEKDIHGSGYVVESLEAALWAFAHSDSFAAGCLKAVNLGEDADTTAAVYGQIAGAFYGCRAIPQTWRNLLWKGQFIGQIADGLFEASVQASTQHYHAP